MKFYGFILLLAAVPSFWGCQNGTNANAQINSNVNAILNDDSIPNPIKDLVLSIANNDSVTFSNLIDYPLARPYPLHDIANSKDMQRYYHILVDDSLRNVIINSTPGAWESFGWRGWSLDNGNYLWIADNVYSVDYISKRENILRDSLINKEMGSLPSSLGRGWSPICCLKAVKAGTVYRIDNSLNPAVASDKAYRLSCYNKNADLRKMPSNIYFGQIEVEGSANNIYYSFTGPAGMDITYFEYPSDQSPLTIIFTDPTGNSHEVEVTPVYWLDILPPIK